MQCYIKDLNKSQEEKEQLQVLHEQIWKEASTVVDVAKTPFGNRVLVLPKNNVPKAIKGLSEINKRFSSPVIGRGGNIITIDKGTEISREQIKIDVSKQEVLFQISSTQRNQINKKLEENILRFLKPFHVTVEQVDSLKDKFGIDAIGATDMIQKIIYLSKNRNVDTLPEEAIHLITQLVGNSPDMKSLFEDITKWSGYKSIRDEYFPIYKNEEKVKFEAVGKLITKALLKKERKTALTGDDLFIRLVKKVNEILDYFFKSDSFFNIPIVDYISTQILKGDSQFILERINNKESKLDYHKTIENSDPVIISAIDHFSNLGLKLTGSLAIASQVNIHRNQNEKIHDLDFTVPWENAFKEDFENLINLDNNQNIKYIGGIEGKYTNTIFYWYALPEYTIKDKVGEFNQFQRRETISIDVYDKNNRLLTDEEKNRIVTPVDIFFPLIDKSETFVANLKSWQDVFKGKLFLSSKENNEVIFQRPKDRDDYILLNPTLKRESQIEDLYFQLNDLENKEVPNSTKNILQSFIDKEDRLSTLAKKLLNNLEDDVPITFVNDLSYQGEIVAGLYHFYTNTIEINSKYKNHPRLSTVVLHETIHAITLGRLLDNQNKPIYKTFLKLYDKAKESFPDHYATSNLDEFMAGIFTNSDFIAKLKTISPINIKHKNLWEDVINTLLNLLGLNRGETLYEQAFNVVSEFIESTTLRPTNDNYFPNITSASKDLNNTTTLNYGRINPYTIYGPRVIFESEIQLPSSERIYENQTSDIDITQERSSAKISNKTINPISIQLADRILYSDKWYTKAFNEIRSRNNNVKIEIGYGENVPLIFQSGDSIIINDSLINKIEWSDELMDIVISEEVIHLVHDNIITEIENKQIYNELTENQIQQIQLAYGSELTKKNIVKEYIRMHVQNILYGNVTEDVTLSFGKVITKALKKALDFVKQYLLNNESALTKQIGDRIIRFEEHTNQQIQPISKRIGWGFELPGISGFQGLRQLSFESTNNPTSRNIVKLQNLITLLQEVKPEFKFEVVENMTDKAFVDFQNSVIFLSSDALIGDISEEAIHVLFELLPNDLQNELIKATINSPVYEQTVNEYRNDPEYQIDGKPNYSKLKKEAAVKLINKRFLGEEIKFYDKESNTILDKVIRFIKSLFSFEQVVEINKIIDEILGGKIQFLDRDLTANGIYKSKRTVLSNATLNIPYQGVNLDLTKVNLVTFHIDCFRKDDFMENNLLEHLTELLYTANALNEPICEIRILMDKEDEDDLILVKSLLDEGAKATIDAPIIQEGNVLVGALRPNRDEQNRFTVLIDGEEKLIFQNNDFTDLEGKGRREEEIAQTKVVGENRFEEIRIKGLTYIRSENFSDTDRTKIIESKKDDFTELLDFYKNDLTKEQQDKLLKSIRKIRFTNESVSKLGIESISQFQLENLKRVKDESDFIQSIKYYLEFINEMSLSIDEINDLLDGNDLNVDQLMTLYNLLSRWKSFLTDNFDVTEGIKDNKLVNSLRELSTKIGDWDTSNLDGKSLFSKLNKNLTERLVDSIYTELIEPYNNGKQNELNTILENLRKLGISEPEIEKELLQLGGKETLKPEWIKKILLGKLGDLGNLYTSGAGTWIGTFFDRHMLGVTNANDPIVAAIGKWHRDVLSTSKTRYESIHLNYLDAQELYENEFEVGERFLVEVDTFLPETEKVKIDLEEPTFIERTILKPIKRLAFANKYGDWMNQNHPLYKQLNNYSIVVKGVEVFNFDTTKTSLNELKFAISNLKEVIDKVTFDNEDEVNSILENLQINYLLMKEDYLQSELTNELKKYRTDYFEELKLQFPTFELNGEKVTFNKYNYHLFLKQQKRINKEKYERLTFLKETIENLESQPNKDFEELLSKREEFSLLKKEIFKKPETNEELFFAKYKEFDKKEKEIFWKKDRQLKALDSQIKLLNGSLELPDIEEDYYLENLVALHASLLRSTENGIDLKENLPLFRFLSEHLNYKGNDDFNEQRNKIFRELEYIRIEQGSIEVLDQDETSPTVEEQLILDQINIGSIPEINKDQFIRGTDLSLSFITIGTRQIPLKNGKPFLKGNSELTSNLWNQVQELTSKYSDGNLVGEFSSDDRKLLYDWESHIDVIRREAIRTKNKRAKELIILLDSLQHDFVNESYYDHFREILSRNRQSGYFKTLIAQSKTPDVFYRQLHPELNNIRQIISDFEGINELSKEEFLSKNPNFTSQDYEIAKWILESHVTKSTIKKDELVINFVPLYAYRKYMPNNTSLMTIDLSYDYQRWELQNKRTDYKFVDGNNLPLVIIPDLITERYDSLTEKERKLHELWVENTFIKTQKESKDKNPYNIEQQGFLGYWSPTMAKSYAEYNYNPIKIVGRLWRDLMGQQAFERGEAGRSDDETKSLWKRILEFFHKGMNENLEEVETLAKDRFENRKLKVNYTGYLDSNEVSRDVFESVRRYTQSLIHKTVIHEQKSFVDATTLTLEKNDPYGKSRKSKGSDYKRLQRIQDYIKQILLQEGIGNNGWFDKTFRIIRTMMYLGSQTILNPFGGIKNFTSSNLSNTIRSLTSEINPKWRKSRTVEFTSSFKWSTKVARDMMNPKRGKESLEYFINRRFNPNGYSDFQSTYQVKNYMSSFGFLYALNNGVEFQVNLSLLLNVLNQFSFKLNDVEVNFQDIWERDNKTWKLKQGVTDINGNPINVQELENEIQGLMRQQSFSTMGHQSDDKGTALYNPFTRTLATFMNFMVSLSLETLTHGRRNYVQKRQIRNYHYAIIRTFLKEIEFLVKHRANYWNVMSVGQKRDFLRGISVYLWGTVLSVIITKLFGFEDDDETEEDDTLKTLENNSTFENAALFVSIRTLAELETQSLKAFQSKTPVPMVFETWDYLKEPMAFRTVTRLGKDVIWQGLKEIGGDPGFKRDNPELGIEKGDSKALKNLQRLFGTNITERTNAPHQIELFYKLNIKQ